MNIWNIWILHRCGIKHFASDLQKCVHSDTSSSDNKAIIYDTIYFIVLVGKFVVHSCVVTEDAFTKSQ